MGDKKPVANMEEMMEFYLSAKTGERFQENADEPIGLCGITHDCPFCGKQASKSRSISWIVSECIKKGEAEYPCNACGKTISVPAKIFLDTAIEKIRQQSIQKNTGQLNEQVLFVTVTKMSPKELLTTNWGEVIDTWNRGIRG